MLILPSQRRSRDCQTTASATSKLPYSPLKPQTPVLTIQMASCAGRFVPAGLRATRLGAREL
eukprot:2798965-Rhodomonas_salina.2